MRSVTGTGGIKRVFRSIGADCSIMKLSNDDPVQRNVVGIKIALRCATRLLKKPKVGNRMHRLTLPHAFRTSCGATRLNGPSVCTYTNGARGTLLTQRYVRAVEGEKERERTRDGQNGGWNGGTEEETETRDKLHGETTKRARDETRQKCRKRGGGACNKEAGRNLFLFFPQYYLPTFKRNSKIPACERKCLVA